jgi:hypothetical protein
MVRAGVKWLGVPIKGLHMENAQFINLLCEWFERQLPSFHSLRTSVLCEFLLCARDLDASGPSIRRAVDSLKAIKSNHHEINLVKELRRQFVLVKYGVGINIRQDFLHYWVVSGEAKKLKNIVTMSFFINLALEQIDLLPTEIADYCRNWFVGHDDLKSIRARAWAPHCLTLAGPHVPCC